MNPDDALFEVIHAGPLTSLQDGGRTGLKSLGIPPGGAMDRVALERANRLFSQPAHTAAWEMLWANMSARCLRDCWIAFSGDAHAWIDEQPVAPERTLSMRCGSMIRFQALGQSLWTYLATPGGWSGPTWFESQSQWPDGGLGSYLRDGDFLCGANPAAWQLPDALAARALRPMPLHDSSTLDVWTGPQWDDFPEASRQAFLENAWTISPQSNRAGFRLQGPPLAVPEGELISEPTLIGSVQVPRDGQPIVLLNDGPTVGGYHKIAVLSDAALDRFRRIPPGRVIRFSPHT